jgi:short-subunit dehydrogenase
MDAEDFLLVPALGRSSGGCLLVTRPAWKVVRQRGYGRVINTCSAAGILCAERMSNYGAAKTG